MEDLQRRGQPGLEKEHVPIGRCTPMLEKMLHTGEALKETYSFPFGELEGEEHQLSETPALS